MIGGIRTNMLGDWHWMGIDSERQYTDIIRQRLKAERVGRGLSQHQVAERAGVNVGTVSRIEAGKIKDLKVSMLATLARALGMPLSALIGEDTDTTNTTPAEREGEQQMHDIILDAAEVLQHIDRFAEYMTHIRELSMKSPEVAAAMLSAIAATNVATPWPAGRRARRKAGPTLLRPPERDTEATADGGIVGVRPPELP